ncbi:MAG: Re/Si-specific NAD(P)(+) transhydrogenase subunit alpha [Pseudomonadota bacterium]
MKIAVLKERALHEARVALTPDTAKKFTAAGYDVWCEKDSGANAGFQDADYKEAGANISSVPLEIVGDADIILKVQPTPISDKINELEFARAKATVIGLLSPFANMQLIQSYAAKNITSIAMELVPRITKAQNMDALSSQNNLIGYRAVIEALNFYGKSMSMMMTSAGTLAPAKVLVLGAGVAGLQAIATAKRLGAIVSAYDVRPSSKEQVESVGGRFIAMQEMDFETSGGYAKELGNKEQDKQAELLMEHASKSDIIISTAQIPGKPAPKLITKSMINNMKRGSVIVDTAVLSGGNIEGSVRDEVVQIGGVKIIGYSNIASHIAHDSSKLYANNLYNFVIHAFSSGKFNNQDEIVKAMIVTHNGKMI